MGNMAPRHESFCVGVIFFYLFALCLEGHSFFVCTSCCHGYRPCNEEGCVCVGGSGMISHIKQSRLGVA